MLRWAIARAEWERLLLMAALALILYALFLFLAFGVRTFMQIRATGSSGFHGISGSPGSVEWIAGVLFVVALVLGVAAPILALTDLVEPIASIDGDAINLIGLLLAVAGVNLTVYSQTSMGSSWRVGVDEGEQTALVTSGAFAFVRNPIFSAMIPTALGLAMMVPSVVSIAALGALIVALELQVRIVEEPYLIRVHGDDYRSYAASTGRFIPGVGRLAF